MAILPIGLGLLLTALTARIALPQTRGRAALSENLRDPQPEDATHAILEAFNTFQIVAIGDFHNVQEIKDFVLSLIRNPSLPRLVNDI